MKFRLTNAKENPFFIKEMMETVKINTLEELLNITDEDIIIYKNDYNDEDNLITICIYNDYVE